MPVDSDFDPEEFIRSCPLNLTGADFYAIGNRARQETLKRLIQSNEESSWTNLEENRINLNSEDFKRSLIGFQPTLSEPALLEYEKYFQNYSNKQ